MGTLGVLVFFFLALLFCHCPILFYVFCFFSSSCWYACPVSGLILRVRTMCKVYSERSAMETCCCLHLLPFLRHEPCLCTSTLLDSCHYQIPQTPKVAETNNEQTCLHPIYLSLGRKCIRAPRCTVPTQEADPGRQVPSHVALLVNPHANGSKRVVARR